MRTTRSGGMSTRGTPSSSPPRGRGFNRGQRGRAPIVWNQGDLMTQQGCEWKQFFVTLLIKILIVLF